MSTAFEFISPEARTIRMPRISVIIFLASALILFIMHLAMKLSYDSLKEDYRKKSAEVAMAASKFSSQAQKLLPEQKVFDDLESRTLGNNFMMGGTRSAWNKLFNRLETIIPENAVVVAIKNAKTDRPVFNSYDRDFKFVLAVSDKEAANLIYQKLSESRIFASLSYTPRGDIVHQGRKGLGIELRFSLREDNE